MKINKEQIIQKTFGLFMTHSYKEVTLSLILKRTGLSKGGFYHHFKSKEELFEAVVELFFFGMASDDGFHPQADNSFLENMSSFLDQKDDAFKMFAQQQEIEDSEVNFFMFILQAIQYLSGVRQKVDILIYKEKRLIEQIIEMAQKNGEIKPEIQKNKMAEIFYSMFDGAELHGVMLSQSFETISKEKEMIKQIYQWVKTG